MLIGLCKHRELLNTARDDHQILQEVNDVRTFTKIEA